MPNDIEVNNIPWADKYYSEQGWKFDRENSDRGSDLIMENMFVEEKFRVGNYGDIAIELFQCLKDIEQLKPKSLGWFYTTKCERLFYFVGCQEDGSLPPDGFYILKWEKFKKWLYQYFKENNFPRMIISPKGYGLSLNVIIEPNLLFIEKDILVYRPYLQPTLI